MRNPLNKRLPRELPLDVSGKKYLVGFFFHVRTRLKPCWRISRRRTAEPWC